MKLKEILLPWTNAYEGRVTGKLPFRINLAWDGKKVEILTKLQEVQKGL